MDTVSVKVVDATDVLKKMFKKKPDTSTIKKTQSVALLPSIGYILIAELEKANVEMITAKKQAFGILEKFQFAVS